MTSNYSHTAVTSLKVRESEVFYLLLAALFISALITCNLIANKFVTIDLGFKKFVVSAGVLPYPVTFLITDIMSEFFGMRRTRRVVFVGFAASLFTLGILMAGKVYNAIPESRVSDDLYNTMFSNTPRLIFASMLAYLVAQYVDVLLYHFWKRVTKGKMLWLRNNGSTIFSQLVDTILVVGVIFAGDLSWSTMLGFISDGWLFKAIIAILDTPVIYAVVYIIKKRHNLVWGQEFTEVYHDVKYGELHKN